MATRAPIRDRVIAWFNHERPRPENPPSDHERLRYEIRPCDVLLVQGRSRIAEVIKSITLSPWTHAALYIGRLHDIDDPNVRANIRRQYGGDPDQQLLIEALLGHGTIITPLDAYHDEHLRICRPREITRRDAQAVITYCAAHLGTEYDTRQLIDLARFMLPYNVLPRRWRSTLFAHNAGGPTRTVCSSLLAEAFASVRYPVLPVIREGEDGRVRLQSGNSRLFTPSDFDHSPYFDIIKYPVLRFDDLEVYRQLPWDSDLPTQQPTADERDNPGSEDEGASRRVNGAESDEVDGFAANLTSLRP